MIGKRVLIVEDDPQFSLIVKNVLEIEGLQTELARDNVEAIQKISATSCDVILLDLVLGEDSGISLLEELNHRGLDIPVIVMTAYGSIETVSEALRMNAFDYITKPFNSSAIIPILKRATEKSQVSFISREESSDVSSAIIGQSSAMIEVFKAIARVSKTDTTVLITGESGTGKELVAHAIHQNSARHGNPFVTLNCGAFTDTLLESELFGHMKGAFTGADRTHRGIFESAAEGTVFLDEISETSPAFQVKLLRVLQERKIRLAGSVQESPIDIRIIAATNQPIESLLNSPDFRRDLLYRLGVINIHLPPLRERTEDIPLLVKAFLKKFSDRQKKKVLISPDTLAWIQEQLWPGNVRELENAIERGVTMNVSGQIGPQDLQQFALRPLAGKTVEQVLAAGFKAIPAVRVVGTSDFTEAEFPENREMGSLNDATREHILRVLKHAQGNKLQTAEILGVGRWSLYRMAARLGIDLKNLTYETKPQRKRTRKKKTETAAFIDNLFENVNDIVYTRDLAGVLTSVNSAAERFFGLSRSKLVGSSLHELLDDPDLEANLCATNERLLREGTDLSVVTIKDHSGRTRVLESNISLIRDTSGNPAGAHGIMRDVTEAKELEEKLRQKATELEEANEKLKELNRLKQDFTAMLVHDLKTPSATMIMALEYLQTGLRLKAHSDISEMIEAALASGHTLRQIVEDMLEIFRYDSTNIQLSCTLLPVKEIIEAPYESANIHAREKELLLSKSIPEDLPSLHVDKLKMCRVISNLLSNALKMTPPGGTISVEAQVAEGWSLDPAKKLVQISVHDSGEGIPPEHLSYIFDPYWQATRKGIGTGLGLAIVKRIVSAHGGQVSVKSRLGVGSEFQIILPPA